MIELPRLRRQWRALEGGGAHRVFVCLSTCGSTNRTAREWVLRVLEAQPSIPQLVLVAEEQTAGRGRLGRTWSSSRGQGIYLTLVEPFSVPRPAWIGLLPLAVGVGALRALRELLEPDCRLGLKWPNDLYAAGKKLGGILIEIAEPPKGASGAAIVGIGINWSHRDNELPTPLATSMAMLAPALPDLETGLARVGTAICEEIVRCQSDPAITIAAYRQGTIHHQGDVLRWLSPAGFVEGVFHGISDAGALRLEVAGQVREIVAGDVFLAREGEDAEVRGSDGADGALGESPPKEEASRAPSGESTANGIDRRDDS